MVLLTCDSDINLALMSSSATEVTAARLQRRLWRRLRPRLNLRANHLRAVTAATDAVAGATDAGSQLTRFLR